MTSNRSNDSIFRSLFCVAALLVLQHVGLAQQPPDGPPPDGGAMQDGSPPPGPFDPAKMLDRLHDQLAVNDEQWPAISAKIQTILQLEHELNAGGRPPRPPEDQPRNGPNGGDPNGGPPPGGPPNDNPVNSGPADQGDGPTSRPAINATADAVRKAKRALGELIHQPDVATTEIHDALNALHDARAAARAELTATQAALKPMVTEPQQAVLMVTGILD